MIDQDALIEAMTQQLGKYMAGLCSKSKNFEETQYDRGRIAELKYWISTLSNEAAQ